MCTPGLVDPTFPGREVPIRDIVWVIVTEVVLVRAGIEAYEGCPFDGSSVVTFLPSPLSRGILPSR